jgi:hypothetical protein
MSRFRVTIAPSVTLGLAHGACLEAISRLGWNIAGIADTRITCQESLATDSAVLSPVRIAIVLSAERQDSTMLTLHGASFGHEPTQTARVRDCVERLMGAIEHEVRRHVAIDTPTLALTAPVHRPLPQAVAHRSPLNAITFARMRTAN